MTRVPYTVNINALKLFACSMAARRTDEVAFAARSDRGRAGDYAKIGLGFAVQERMRGAKQPPNNALKRTRLTASCSLW